MKAISINQPFSSLIIEGIKDIENRTWPTKYRGRVLVHASANIDKGAIDKISHFDNESARRMWFKIAQGKLDLGAIIGSVEIVDCVINHESIWAEKTDTFADIFIKPTYNWVLANPIKFPVPIPAKGKLNFWDYPNILAELE